MICINPFSSLYFPPSRASRPLIPFTTNGELPKQNKHTSMIPYTNPFTRLAIYNVVWQYCTDNLQGSTDFLSFVLNLPPDYLTSDITHLHLLFNDKSFTP